MNIKKILIMGGGALALVGASVGGTLFFTGAFNEQPVLPPDAAAAMPVEEVIPPLPALPEDIFYHNIQPEFVVNFYGKSRTKFLMIEMVVGTYDEKLIPILSDHDPEIRDTILTLLSEQDSEVLRTPEGKEALRNEAVSRLDKVIGRYYRTERIEDVYITRMVMQ